MKTHNILNNYHLVDVKSIKGGSLFDSKAFIIIFSRVVSMNLLFCQELLTLQGLFF